MDQLKRFENIKHVWNYQKLSDYKADMVSDSQFGGGPAYSMFFSFNRQLNSIKE